jgi:hypothetical protein
MSPVANKKSSWIAVAVAEGLPNQIGLTIPPGVLARADKVIK